MATRGPSLQNMGALQLVRLFFASVVFLTFSWLGGCGGEAPPEAPVAPAEPVRVAEPRSDGPAIVAFGDSLTAGLGLPRAQSYPALLERELGRRDLDFRVVNEGVSGETTAAGLARVDLALSNNPELVIIAFGANDGLRGLSIERMEANLQKMVRRFKSAGSQVVLAGMKLPPNYSREYVSDFESVYPRLSQELEVPLIPFLLEGVAAEPALNQADGIHPTAEGNEIVARLVADFVEPLLREE